MPAYALIRAPSSVYGQSTLVTASHDRLAISQCLPGYQLWQQQFKRQHQRREFKHDGGAEVAEPDPQAVMNRARIARLMPENCTMTNTAHFFKIALAI